MLDFTALKQIMIEHEYILEYLTRFIKPIKISIILYNTLFWRVLNLANLPFGNLAEF